MLFRHRIFLILIALFVTTCSSHTANLKNTSPLGEIATVQADASSDKISRLLNSTVILISKEEGTYCTGFFVSEKHIVTARHCVVQLAEPEGEETEESEYSEGYDAGYDDALTELGIEIVVEPNEPEPNLVDIKTVQEISEMRLHYLTYRDYSTEKGFKKIGYPARISYIDLSEKGLTDPARDVAILKVSNKKYYSKTWLDISVDNLKPGEQIESVSSPLGFPWFYSKGSVAQLEYKRDGKSVEISGYYASNILVAPGASGSPVANSKGEVVGIITMQVENIGNVANALPSTQIMKKLEKANWKD